jgi:hypothetical protein
MTTACSRLLFVFFVCFVVAPASAADPTYWQDVRPLLRKNCTVCHNPRQASEPEISGGLTLDTYQAVLKWSSKKKSLLTPGKSGESLLYQVVVTTDTDKRMPLGAKPLPPKPSPFSAAGSTPAPEKEPDPKIPR